GAAPTGVGARGEGGGVMMRSQSGDPGRGGVPAGLLGAIALMVAVELALAHDPFRFGLPDWGDWARAGRAARGAAREGEVLCFGDSTAKAGLQPRVLAWRLGRPVRSFAVAAGSPAASYFLLRRALDSGARPSAILVDLHPGLICDDPRTYLNQFAQ